MLEEIEKEIEEKYVRKFAFNDERQFIFYDDLLFLLDKYNNQPDYKSAWNDLKEKYIEYIDEYYNLFDDIKELEQKYNLGGE